MQCEHHVEETECPRCIKEVQYALLREKNPLRDWAREGLGLSNRKQVRRSRHTHDPDEDVNK